jgi:hypothetical protein
MLASAGANAKVQFVELLDKGGSEEAFPPLFAPYKLVIFNGAGAKLGQHLLNAAGMRSAAATSPPKAYLISTPAADAALGVTGNEKLNVALPLHAGQACYTAMSSDDPYSCITWGCISHAVDASTGTGSAHGAVPPNGKSAQRQPNDSIQIASPTPKKPNATGTKPPACAFAGVRIKDQTVTVKQGTAPIAVTCPGSAKGSCTGTLVLRTAHAINTSNGKKVVKLGQSPLSIPAGKKSTVSVKLSDEGKQALAKNGKLDAIARVTAHDGTGKSKVTSANVTLQRPQNR